jgi:Protein of unknown function (DUF3830)
MVRIPRARTPERLKAAVMSRTIILKFVEADVAAVAALAEEWAPATCGRIWELLPLEGKTVHGMYSGPEVFIRADAVGPLPAENGIHRALPGDVGYWWHAGGVEHTAPQDAGEILFIYDRGAAIMGPDGQPTWANLFARITGEATDFYAEARKVRTEGPRILRIERGEELASGVGR